MDTLLQYRLGYSHNEANALSDEEWAEKIAQLEDIIKEENKASR